MQLLLGYVWFIASIWPTRTCMYNSRCLVSTAPAQVEGSREVEGLGELRGVISGEDGGDISEELPSVSASR